MTDKPNPLAAFSPAQLIQAYSQLQKQVDELNAGVKEKVAPLTQRMNALTNELLHRMESEGVTNYSTDFGRMTRKTHQNYSVQDIVAFSDYVIENKDLTFFGKSLSKPAVQAYIKQHEKTPPGVRAFSEYSIAFTKK
jgi:hypothetical protein